MASEAPGRPMASEAPGRPPGGLLGTSRGPPGARAKQKQKPIPLEGLFKRARKPCGTPWGPQKIAGVLGGALLGVLRVPDRLPPLGAADLQTPPPSGAGLGGGSPIRGVWGAVAPQIEAEGGLGGSSPSEVEA